MSEALQEARAYTAVNEVMVFKGGRGMNVSKKDLPVFRAKGWELKEELEEADMKRLLQALQDKLSKEGGAAGFDDLKKTAKTMGVNLTPAMLKGAPGIKQHRDGDYILEGGPGSGPQKGKMKPGAGTRKGSAKDGGQTDKEADDYDSQIAGEAFEEAFTRKDFQKLETTNDHTEAAEKLINMFGTKEEKFAMAAIKARHNMTGYINGKDYSKRQMMVNKYYSRLK